METFTFRAMWPITDPSTSWQRLCATARRDLPTLAIRAGADLGGEGRFYVARSVDVPGSGRTTEHVLVYEAPAAKRPQRDYQTLGLGAHEPWPDDADEPEVEVSPVERRKRELVEMADLGRNLAEVCRALGVTRQTLRDWCRRNGHGDLYMTLASREGDWNSAGRVSRNYSEGAA